MARFTKDYGFAKNDGSIDPIAGSLETYDTLIVLLKETALQNFFTNHSDINVWAGPGEDGVGEGYYIAYVDNEPRETPVDGVEGDIGFLRASTQYGGPGATEFVAFVNSRFGASAGTGGEAHEYLIANGMWSTWPLYNI